MRAQSVPKVAVHASLKLLSQKHSLWHYAPPIRIPCTACAQPRSAGKRKRSTHRKLDPVRADALQQLLRVEQEGAFAGLVGGSPPEAPAKRSGLEELDSRDRAQVTARVAGATRLRRRLDWLLQQLLKGPLHKVQPEVQAILRLALYELTELGLPDHAVNAHVDLASLAVNRACRGLVNGVLRNATRLRAAGALPEPQPAPATAGLEERAESLGVVHSHPTWLVRRWLKRWGDAETAELLAWNNAAPTYCLRVNTLRTSAAALADEAGVRLSPSHLLPDDFLCVEAGLQAVFRAGAVASGLCQVQDQAAGLVVALLDPQPGERVLDACAAPGGKALFAACRMASQGCLVAADSSEARLKGLADMGDRQGLAKGFLVVRPGDLRETGAELARAADRSGAGHGGFDRVLVDAPCSGTGVLAKRADMRWRRTPQELQDLIGLQAELLDAAARVVRPGGLLVYSTCSLEPEENEEQVARFLDRAPEFTVQPAPASLLPPDVLSSEGFLATLPHRHAVDGAFAARLLRVG